MRKDKIARDTIKINKLVETFCQKYQELITFIPVSEVELMFHQVIDEMPDYVDFNPEFQASFLVERKFFLKARDEILAGNIDLEILIVEKYLSISKFLLRQLKYKGDDFETIAEEGIIICTENYDGSDGFKNALLKQLRKLITPKVEAKVESEVAPQEIENLSISDDQTTLGVTTLPVAKDVNEAKEELVIPSDGIVRQPNQLELLMHSIDILNQVPLEDERYLKFISLKYGYYQNQYFDLGEISTILNISISEAIQYYTKSLEYMKNWFGLKLDQVYTYYIQKSE